MFSDSATDGKRWPGMALRIGVCCALLLVGMLAYLYYPAGDLATFRDADGYLFGRDFANLYAGACAVLDGAAVEELYQPKAYQLWMEQLYDGWYPPHSWSYPPSWLTLIWPACLTDYATAFLLYMTVTALLFVAALRLYAPSNAVTLVLLFSAPAVMSLWAGHNGFLTAALLLAALHWREAHPWRTALCLCVLTIKPHLGLLIPILFMMEGRWALIAKVALCIAGWVMISGLWFGWQAWAEYLTITAGQQMDVLQHWTGPFLAMMVSPYALARQMAWATPWPMLLQVLCSAALLVWYVRLLRRGDREQNTLATAAFAVMIFPYMFAYDALPLLAAALIATQRFVRCVPIVLLAIAEVLLCLQLVGVVTGLSTVGGLRLDVMGCVGALLLVVVVPLALQQREKV